MVRNHLVDKVVIELLAELVSRQQTDISFKGCVGEGS